MRPILRVGLTGGIASGKTTVARIFEGLGAFVLEADVIARQLMRPGTEVHRQIVARFGSEILEPDTRLSRKHLAQIVFSDASARAALEAIVHPAVRREVEQRIAEYVPSGRSPISVFDAALLVETGSWREYRRLVVARCSRATQIHRLQARDGLSSGEAESRVEAQAPLADKLAVAHYVIDTEGTLRQTRCQTEQVWAALLADFDSEFNPSPA